MCCLQPHRSKGAQVHECSPECEEPDKRKGGEESEGEEEAGTLLLTMETLGQGTGLTHQRLSLAVVT